MTSECLYTVICEYKGGTYISQQRAVGIREAIQVWMDSLTDRELKAWNLNRELINSIARQNAPSALNGLVNVWCFSGIGDEDDLLLVNIVTTDQRTAI